MKNKEIWIEENIIHYDHFNNIETLDIDRMKYAYVHILGGIPYLYIFSDTEHYISTELDDFNDVYRELSKIFNFDNETFFTISKNKIENEKAKIWTKNFAKNYQFLEGDFQDGDFGYEIYTEPKQMLSWDSTYEELDTKGYIEYYTSSYGTQYARFKYPVRVEDILINRLELYVDNVIRNRPIQEFYVDLYDNTLSDQSYKELRDFWLDEDIDVDDFGWEREDQCYLRFQFAEGIAASIRYDYDDESTYSDGSTSLHFYNERSYEHFLINEDYEKIIEFSELLTFDKSLEINLNHMENDSIKHIPIMIKNLLRDNSGIWFDRKNQKVGFSGTDTALILNNENIKSFTVINYLPSRGPGYSQLKVETKNEENLDIFTADTHFFDSYVQPLREITGKVVNTPEAYYND